MTASDYAILEQLLDRNSLTGLLDALSEVCSEKQEHVATNWQDRALARIWGTAAYRVAECAHHHEVARVP